MQIKAALAEYGRLEWVKACVEMCIETGHAWVAASVALELQRKGGLQANALRRDQQGFQSLSYVARNPGPESCPEPGIQPQLPVCLAD